MTPIIERIASQKRLPPVELTLGSHFVNAIAALRIKGPNAAVSARSIVFVS
jgi:hypothetical protein